VIACVKKVCNILNCFTGDAPAWGNSEIAEKLEMNPSTVHHLVRTLCQEGMLIQDERKKYRLGWKLLEWSHHVAFQQEVKNEAHSRLEGEDINGNTYGESSVSARGRHGRRSL
jgi:DNA-binding IclR family transcriptional regulator